MQKSALVFAQVSQGDLDSIAGGTPDYNPKADDCTTPASAGGNSSVDRYMQVLAQHESGGSPTAVNPAGAYGKYQYQDATWNSTAKTYYPAGQQYQHASDAPEEVQDAVTYLRFTDLFREFNGDIITISAIQYLGHVPSQSELDQVPGANEGNVETVRQFGQGLIDDIANNVGINIPLKYASAPDFQTWLAKVGGAATATNASSTQVSSSTQACQKSEPQGNFVFYSQYDPKWIDHPYGTSAIGPSGCGPTSVAEVVATLIDKSVTPVETADWGTQNGAYGPDGTSWSVMLVQGPQHWGLKSTELGTDMDKAISVLKAGGLVIAAGQGPVPFTSVGHILVLRGVTPEGKLLLGDPAHPDANTQEWDTSQLLPYIGGMFGITK